MTTYLGSVALALLATLGLGLVRVWRGPTASDRLSSVLLSGTTGIALLLILSAGSGTAATLDVALVLAALAPVVVAAYVAARRPGGSGEKSGG